MGTHPIFESDFDCLTDNLCFFESSKKKTKEIDNCAGRKWRNS